MKRNLVFVVLSALLLVGCDVGSVEEEFDYGDPAELIGELVADGMSQEEAEEMVADLYEPEVAFASSCGDYVGLWDGWNWGKPWIVAHTDYAAIDTRLTMWVWRKRSNGKWGSPVLARSVSVPKKGSGTIRYDVKRPGMYRSLLQVKTACGDSNVRLIKRVLKRHTNETNLF